MISIERVSKMLLNYKFIELKDGSGGQNILIDEDLFVYIVEKYDGLSRLMEMVTNVEDRSCYLSRHTYEINLRGLNMLSNQKTVKLLGKKGKELNDLYQSTLVLLSGEVTRLVKEEATLCLLDPSSNIDSIVND